jgi:hypothetical protein
MLLTLNREIYTQRSTIGSLAVDGKFHSFTLEDCVRPVKIPGKTAIPAGRYEVIINWSARFKRPLPLLLNVPFFAGVRIHAGNTDVDTEGCILVGRTRQVDFIGESRKAFDLLFKRLSSAIAKEKIYMEILDLKKEETGS